MEPPDHTVVSVSGPPGMLQDIYAQCIGNTDFLKVRSTECNLKSPIHPIFAYEQWHDNNMPIIPVLYEKMKPALQLASLWITDDRMLDWFYEDTASETKFVEREGTRFAYRELHPGLNLQNPADRQRVRELWLQKLNDLQNIGNLRFQMHNMAEWGVTIYHHMLTEVWKQNPGYHICDLGNIFAVFQNGVWVPTKVKSSPQIVISDLFKHFLDSVPCNTAQLSDGLKKELLSFHFLLATTLVHELAHAANYFPKFRLWHPDGGYEEAYHNIDEVNAEWRPYMGLGAPESGWSWMAHTFNDPIMPKMSLLPQLPQIPRLDTPACFRLGSSWLFLMKKSVWINHERFQRKGLEVPGDEGAWLQPAESILKWFRKEHWKMTRSKHELLNDAPQTYFLDTHLHEGGVTVSVKIFQTSDLN